MAKIDELIAQALRKQGEVVNGEGVTGEGFATFLIDYVISGGVLTNNGTSLTISAAIISFKENLYEIKETILPVPHGMLNKTLYVDFRPEFGFVLADVHPGLPYLPIYSTQTDASGNVVSFTDQRGPVGDMRFKPEYTVAVFPSLGTAIDGAEAATTAANTAAGSANTAAASVNTAITNASEAATAANTAKTGADTAASNASQAATAANTAASNASEAATAANTAKTNADTAADAANTAASAANVSKTNADTAAASANTAKTNADNAAASANTAAASVNTAISNADTAAASANTAKTNADNAAASANTAKTNADTAASAANTAKTGADNAASSANTAATNANEAATTTRLNYLTPVINYADIAATYPTPAVGDVVQVSSENKHYRWNGSTWVFISDFNLSGAESVANKGVPNGYAGLDGTGKVPASQLPSTTGGAAHAGTHVTGGSDVIPEAVANGNSGLMSGAIKAKVNAISPGANRVWESGTNGNIIIDGAESTVYTHPTGDGNQHVPATGTTNNTKVLKAGANAGSAAWGNVDLSEATGAVSDSQHGNRGGGALHAAAVAGGDSGFLSGADKAKLDGVQAGAEVNQNAFSIITAAGQQDILADGKSDLLNLVAGTGMTISTDPATDTITFTASGSSGVTTGTGAAYTLNASPALTALVDYAVVAVKWNTDNTGACTIDVNGQGAKAIKKSNGTDLAAGTLKADSIATLRYSSTANGGAGAFILQGEGGDSAAPTPIVPDPVDPYVRPADWLALPTVLGTEKKVVGLYAVYPHDSNFMALSCSGNYTVNWGDGTAPENIASGVTAQHIYDYNVISPTTDTSRGYRQVIVTITPQAGQTLTTVNLGVKHSQAGLQNSYITGWLDLKMAGSTVTSLTLQAGTSVKARLLEIFEWVGTNAIPFFQNMFQDCSALQWIPAVYTGASQDFSLTFYGCASLQAIPTIDTSKGKNFSSMFTGCANLRSVPLLSTSVGTNFSSMFGNCVRLKTIPQLDTSKGTNFSSMFAGCHGLTTIPLLNTVLGTDFSSMFSTCYNLESVPLLNTAAAQNVQSMFQTCYTLREIPLLNTASVTNFSTMFSLCANLTTIPLLNTGAGTSFNSMFSSCTNLTTIPLLNTANGTNFSSMFNGCNALQSVPLLDTSKGTNFANMFTSCNSLESVPLLNTGLGTTFNAMFSPCSNLKSIPVLNTALGTNFSTMFQNCPSLQSVPLLDTSKGTNMTGMFTNCYSLSKGRVNGTKSSVSYQQCRFSAAALEDIFNGLADLTALPAQSITINGNWGTSFLTPAQRAVATNKNWTILPASPDLTVSATTVPAQWDQGATNQELRITVTNTNDPTTANIVVTVISPSIQNATLTSISGTGWTGDVALGTATNATVLPKNGSSTVSFFYTVSASAGANTDATCTVSTTGEVYTANNSIIHAIVIRPSVD